MNSARFGDLRSLMQRPLEPDVARDVRSLVTSWYHDEPDAYAELVVPYLAGFADAWRAIRWDVGSIEAFRYFPTSMPLGSIRLSLFGGDLEAYGAEIAEDPRFALVTELTCHSLEERAEALLGLLGSPDPPRIERFHAWGSESGDLVVDMLAVLPIRESLRELSLTSCGVTNSGVASLASSEVMGRLRRLDLSNNPLGLVGVVALSISGSSLRSLVLFDAGVDDAGARVLASAEGLYPLDRLDLSENDISDAGAQAFLDSETFDVVEFSISGDISESMHRRLCDEVGALTPQHAMWS